MIQFFVIVCVSLYCLYYFIEENNEKKIKALREEVIDSGLFPHYASRSLSVLKNNKNLTMSSKAQVDAVIYFNTFLDMRDHNGEMTKYTDDEEYATDYVNAVKITPKRFNDLKKILKVDALPKYVYYPYNEKYCLSISVRSV